jgi:hypothetical protein
MTHDQAQSLISEFVSDQEMQQMVAEALNYCAALSTAVAFTHGFHEDEQVVAEMLKFAAKEHPKGSLDDLSWLSAQLLTAEFGRIMSEAGEAIENVRKPGPDDHCPQFPGWHVEAIDILVRVFDTLGKRGISPGEIFVAKTLVNNARAHKHGKNS